MKASTPIDLVKPIDYDALNDVYAVFASKEKATQFVDKFKNRPDMDIIDGILSPDYRVDITAAPYYISLTQSVSIPLKNICYRPEKSVKKGNQNP